MGVIGACLPPSVRYKVGIPGGLDWLVVWEGRESKHTVDGEVIGVLVGRATGLELGRGVGVDGDGIRSEEAVHVALVLARENNRIDVLQHELLGDDHGVGMRETGRGYQGKEIHSERNVESINDYTDREQIKWNRTNERLECDWKKHASMATRRFISAWSLLPMVATAKLQVDYAHQARKQPLGLKLMNIAPGRTLIAWCDSLKRVPRIPPTPLFQEPNQIV